MMCSSVKRAQNPEVTFLELHGQFEAPAGEVIPKYLKNCYDFMISDLWNLPTNRLRATTYSAQEIELLHLKIEIIEHQVSPAKLIDWFGWVKN
jgi:hypothetical protein